MSMEYETFVEPVWLKPAETTNSIEDIKIIFLIVYFDKVKQWIAGFLNKHVAEK